MLYNTLPLRNKEYHLLVTLNKQDLCTLAVQRRLFYTPFDQNL
jgi:hypothetical protein